LYEKDGNVWGNKSSVEKSKLKKKSKKGNESSGSLRKKINKEVTKKKPNNQAYVESGKKTAGK